MSITFMGDILAAIFYHPLLNLLVFLYNTIPGHDIGVAIIVLTIIIKLILHPFTVQSLKSQKMMQELQPKVDAVKQQYKDQKDKLAQEMMKLYKEEKVNPFSSCLPLLIQLPFLFALYAVFQQGLSTHDLTLYPFIANPGPLNPIAFGFFDLAKPLIPLGIITGIAQWFQTRMFTAKRPPVKTPGAKDEDMMAQVNRNMTVIMPVMTIAISWTLPSGLVLYWLVTTLISIIQQQFILKTPAGALPPATS